MTGVITLLLYILYFKLYRGNELSISLQHGQTTLCYTYMVSALTVSPFINILGISALQLINDKHPDKSAIDVNNQHLITAFYNSNHASNTLPNNDRNLQPIMLHIKKLTLISVMHIYIKNIQTNSYSLTVPKIVCMYV